MGSATGDIRLDVLIQDAIRGDRDALNTLIVDPWTADTLNEVSIWAAGNYRQDRNDIRQILTVKTYDKIHTVRNPEGHPWCDCLKSWFYSVAKHHCWNEGRHDKVVRSHRDDCASDESARGRLKSISGGSHTLQLPSAHGPEQELLEKERVEQAQAAFRRLLALFPRQRKIMELWNEGKSAVEIVAITGKSAATVYRVEKQILKALAKEVRNSLDGKKNAA